MLYFLMSVTKIFIQAQLIVALLLIPKEEDSYEEANED